MTVLKSTLEGINGIVDYLINLQRSIRILFLISIPAMTGCSFIWPFSEDRQYSLALEVESHIGQDELVELLEVSEGRYQELVKVGAKLCLPARMNSLQRQHWQIRQALDVHLKKEAAKRLEDTFSSLETVRQLLEEQAATTGCPIQYVLRERTKQQKTADTDDSVLGLSSWAQPESLPLLRRSR